MQHPAAKSIIEVARTQDEEVGDGTTSVIILSQLLIPFDSIFGKHNLIMLDNF